MIHEAYKYQNLTCEYMVTQNKITIFSKKNQNKSRRSRNSMKLGGSTLCIFIEMSAQKNKTTQNSIFRSKFLFFLVVSVLKFIIILSLVVKF